MNMTTFKIGLAIGLGVFLIPFCFFRAWTAPTYPSIKPWPSGTAGVGPSRPLVDEWSWSFLNAWYANVEDGVSGQQAWVWDSTGVLVPYVSTFPSWMQSWSWAIAIAWSVWRNNANNLKRPLRDDSWLQQ